MGFGGGAMIGGPLAGALMSHFKSATSVGVAPTMAVMGVVYFLFMMIGVFLIRTPPPDWKPAGYVKATQSHGMIAAGNVDVGTAFTTPQFWLLWIMLCANVTAGIGILEQAQPMIREMFQSGKTIETSRITFAAATGFVGLLSLFNMGGRFFWSSVSDYLGRKTTYVCFFLIGSGLYAALPHTGLNGLNSVPIFVAITSVLISMYGGGFATIPAYLRDLFGTMHVSAIHGRLLTAWSTAGVLGPLLVNYIRDHEIEAKVAPTARYTTSMYVMAGLLIIGLICDLLVRPVDPNKTVEARGRRGVGPAAVGTNAQSGAAAA